MDNIDEAIVRHRRDVPGLAFGKQTNIFTRGQSANTQSRLHGMAYFPRLTRLLNSHAELSRQYVHFEYFSRDTFDNSGLLGMGRGDAFAGNANGGMGTLDWEDTKTMLDEAVLQGIADPSRLAIAGKSQGGFLTAWGVTRLDSPFKAGIMIDGVSDWGSLVLSSDLPDFEVRGFLPSHIQQ